MHILLDKINECDADVKHSGGGFTIEKGDIFRFLHSVHQSTNICRWPQLTTRSLGGQIATIGRDDGVGDMCSLPSIDRGGESQLAADYCPAGPPLLANIH
jgi:hypothetical protein